MARAGLSESYFESGPQSVTQLVISFSRGCEMVKYQDTSFLLFPGRFDASIIFGVVVSVLSLSWGSSRAFFIERTPDQANQPFPSSLADSVFLPLSWNTNEYPSTDKLSRPIILFQHLLLGFGTSHPFSCNTRFIHQYLLLDHPHLRRTPTQP